LPWQRPLPSNGALDIQQLWASGGRTREPILMKYSIQQQIRTIIVFYDIHTWSNIKISKIQNGGRSYCWKYMKCHNSPANGLTANGRNLGGCIPLCSQYWKCCNSICIFWVNRPTEYLTGWKRWVFVKKINTIWWNIKINLQKLVDKCGYELPTHLQHFRQKDLTEVKIFLKALGGYFF